MKRLRALIVLLFTLALAGHFSAAWCQQRPSRPRRPAEIRGQVRLAHGPAAPHGVMITLDSDQAGYVAQAQTDSLGKFAFSQIAPETYVIRARHPGYQEATQRVDLTMSPTAYVILELQPIPRRAPAPAPPVGSSGGKISAGQLLTEQLAIPEGARKAFEKGHKLLIDSKDPGKSLDHFRKAIGIYPSYAEAYFFLGMAFLDLSKRQDAGPALRKAVELNDQLAPAHLALGVCENLQGNFAAAEKPLLRGLELNPEAADGYYELGKAYWSLGRWQEAEPHARKAISLRADYATAHLLLGNILLRKRDAPAALQEFKEYLRLEPSGALAAPTRNLVAKIEKALGSPGDRNP